MGRASSTKPVAPPLSADACEQCWTLVGQRRGRIGLARRMMATSGERTSVRFDGARVLRREEARGDVVGFLHTHPNGPAVPSRRDVRTMRAWCSAFGKPLLCFIASPEGLRGYRFDDDAAAGIDLAIVESFRRGVVIGVEAHG